MFRWMMLAALAALPPGAGAVVCKTVDAEGVVSYSDVPAVECPNPVRLPHARRNDAPLLPRSQSPGQASSTGSASDVNAAYSSLSITTPATGSTVRSNDGQVFVSVKAIPTMLQGHLLRLTIDGRAIPQTFPTASVELRNVQRGTHTLSVAILDAEGTELATSPEISFTLLSVPVTPEQSQ